MSQTRVKRIAKFALAFFVLDMLLDWRSVATWDWRHINRLSGAFNVIVGLVLSVCAALLAGIIFDLAFYGWFLPKLLRWRSHQDSRT